jgi:hypothetical protein
MTSVNLEASMNAQIIPQKFTEKFGPPWIPATSDLEDEYGAAYLAYALKRQIDEIFQGGEIRRKAPRLRVHCVILSSYEVRALTWRHGSEPHEYVLAMKTGMFERFSEILSQEELWRNLLPELKFLNTLDIRNVTRIAVELGAFAIAAHEIAHIMRGHFGLQDSLLDEPQEMQVEYRKLLEVDADKWGAYLLAGQVMAMARKLMPIPIQLPYVLDMVAFELISVLAVSLYRCNSLYNQIGTKLPTLYPHPLLRAANIAIGAADNFSKNEDPEHVRRRLLSALLGLANADEFGGRSMDLPQKAWDIGKELVKFEASYNERLKALAQELVPHSPSRY